MKYKCGCRHGQTSTQPIAIEGSDASSNETAQEQKTAREELLRHLDYVDLKSLTVAELKSWIEDVWGTLRGLPKPSKYHLQERLKRLVPGIIVMLSVSNKGPCLSEVGDVTNLAAEQNEESWGVQLQLLL